MASNFPVIIDLSPYPTQPDSLGLRRSSHAHPLRRSPPEQGQPRTPKFGVTTGANSCLVDSGSANSVSA